MKSSMEMSNIFSPINDTCYSMVRMKNYLTYTTLNNNNLGSVMAFVISVVMMKNP